MATEMEETQAGTRSIGEKLKRCKEKSRGGCGDRWGSNGQESLGVGAEGGSPFFSRCPPQTLSLSLRKMDPPPSLMTMLSAQTLINTLS